MDFISQFEEREKKQFTLESLKDYSIDTIWLRALSRSDCSYFRRMVDMMKQKRAKSYMETLSGEEKSQKEVKSILSEVRDEDWLIYKSLCDQSGKMLFDSPKDMEPWLKNVSNEICNEILDCIDQFNTLDGSCPRTREAAENLAKEQQEEQKKK